MFCSSNLFYTFVNVLTKLTKHILIMQLTDEVFNILRQDYHLRREISDKIKPIPDKPIVREVNVYRWATRKSFPKWYEKETMIIINKYLKKK